MESWHLCQQNNPHPGGHGSAAWGTGEHRGRLRPLAARGQRGKARCRTSRATLDGRLTAGKGERTGAKREKGEKGRKGTTGGIAQGHRRRASY